MLDNSIFVLWLVKQWSIHDPVSRAESELQLVQLKIDVRLTGLSRC